MTTSARSRSWLAGALSRHSHAIRVAVPFAALLSSLALAAPASAVVTESEGVTVGLQPRTVELHAPTANFANNSGNTVVDGASVYLVFWDPGAWFHHEWVEKVDAFAQRLGAASGEDGSIFSALSQYRNRANEPAEYKYVFKGSYSDTAPYPAAQCTDPAPLTRGQLTCITDAQLREQLQSFIASQGTLRGMHAVYYVLTPPGVSVCLTAASTHCSDFALSSTEVEKQERASTSYKNSFCSYHGAINPTKAPQGDGNTILYAAIPWSAGYEGHPWNFQPAGSMAGQAADCQDGGWNPEKHEETHEAPKVPTKAEEEAFEKQNAEEKAKTLKARELEKPHIEEPNQEVELDEEGDYAAALPDVLVNQIAVELANIVTDPLLASWQNSSTGAEATDECRDTFAGTAGASAIGGVATAALNTEAGGLFNSLIAGGHYYINNVINNGALHYGSQCVGGYGLVPRFTSPNPVNSGEVVDFNGMESTVSEFKRALFGPSGPPTTTWATFTWNFGDGTTLSGYAPGGNPNCTTPWLPPCAGSAFHSYTYGGTYAVSLTVTDVGGDVAKVEHLVTVNGPTPPGSSPGSTSGTAGAGSNGNGTGTGAGSSPPPLATAAIVSRHLKSVLRKGLLVTYTVNEQVAGHLDVLISKALAQRLKLAGAPAEGLPAGTPPEVVIGKAVLVAVKAGKGTVTIKFSRSVAARLAKQHSLSLLLRVFVHSTASATGPTATVLSTTTLG